MSLPMPKERNLYFSEQVDQSSIKKLTEDIVAINDNDKTLVRLYDVYEFTYNPKPINIHIDSYGGNVYQILGLLSIMETSTTPIHTYATGAAMSCGFMMLICGHKRFAHKYATPLYHQVSTGTWGKLDEIKDDLKEGKRLQKIFEDIIVKKTKITRKKMKEVNTLKKDWYMSPQEALDWGVVDEII